MRAEGIDSMKRCYYAVGQAHCEQVVNKNSPDSVKARKLGIAKDAKVCGNYPFGATNGTN